MKPRLASVSVSDMGKRTLGVKDCGKDPRALAVNSIVSVSCVSPAEDTTIVRFCLSSNIKSSVASNFPSPVTCRPSATSAGIVSE